MFKGNQQVKIRRITTVIGAEEANKPTQKKDKILFNTKEEAIFIFNPDIIKTVAEKIQKNIWNDATDEEKVHFFNVIYALIKSVRRDALVLYKKEPDFIDHCLKYYFDRLQAIEKSKDWSSPFFHAQVNAKYDFYTKAFDYRSMIQNYDWSYKWIEKREDGTYKKYNYLDEDTPLFMKLREKYKMYYDDLKCFKNLGKAPLCQNCNKPCGTYRPSIKATFCTYCYNFDKLEIYLKIANCLHIMGSYFMFYFYLPETTYQFLFDNLAIVNRVFSKDISSTPLDLYFSQMTINSYKQTKDVIREEIQKKEDGEYIKALEVFQEAMKRVEEEAQKKRDLGLQRVMKEAREMKREIKEKKKEKEKYMQKIKERAEEAKKEKEKEKEDEDFEVNIVPEPKESKDEEEIERAAHIKSLMDYFHDSRSVSNCGDKSLDDIL